MKYTGKTNECFFMVMNIANVNFMALIHGHKFSMNYITFSQPMKIIFHGHDFFFATMKNVFHGHEFFATMKNVFYGHEFFCHQKVAFNGS